MADEIELKLAMSEEQAQKFPQLFSNQGQHYFLRNTYYDTAKGFLAQHKMGLRVREQNGEFIQTLKTDGSSLGGLHMRPEYNHVLPDCMPNLSLLAEQQDIYLGQNIEALQAQLQPIFSTDFHRQVWTLKFAHSEIEVALDQGEIKANQCSETIREVEFELKHGKISDLLAYVQSLSLQQAYLSSTSKAKRGYALAQGGGILKANWLEKWHGVLDKLSHSVSVQEKMTALLVYEQELIEETISLGIAAFSSDFLQTVSRISPFFNLYHYYVSELKQALAEITEQHLIELLMESSASLFEQIRHVIQQHSVNRDNQQALAKLFALVQGEGYIQRMLTLIQLTVSKNG